MRTRFSDRDFNSLITHLKSKLRTPLSEYQLGNLIRAIEVEYDFGSRAREQFSEKLRESRLLKALPIKWQVEKSQKYYCTNLELNPLVLAHAIGNGSYFCFRTALYFHGLLSKIPAEIHQAKERPSRAPATAFKYDDARLKEEFSKSARISNRTARYKGRTLYFLEREHSGNTGVIDLPRPDDPDGVFQVTTLERTLLDCAVSPHYAGGYAEVLKVFRRCKVELNVEALHSLYSGLVLRYPYWQRIGHFLERGVSAKSAKLWRAMFGEPQFRFYAEKDYAEDWAFDEYWNLVHPETL